MAQLTHHLWANYHNYNLEEERLGDIQFRTKGETAAPRGGKRGGRGRVEVVTRNLVICHSLIGPQRNHFF